MTNRVVAVSRNSGHTAAQHRQGSDKLADMTVLVETVLELLSGLGKLNQRRMFGGTYIYCDGLFIATVHDERLYFKANANTAPAFLERGLEPFSYLRQGEVATLQYYEAPPEVFEGQVAMKRWATKALVAAREDASTKQSKVRD